MRSTRLSPAGLSRYCARVGYRGEAAVSLATVRALHRAHLLSIPYENLDIHLGVPLALDTDRIFTKLVDDRRGGWCYEMNGLFAHVLESLGFDVRLVAGAVGRAELGWRALGNHLVLIVTLDRPWIVDVGFGDGFLTPLPLEQGTYTQSFLQYHVSRDGPRWRVDNHAYGGADGFDFTLTPRTLADFATQCRELQSSADSGFVKTTVIERFTRQGLVMLRGAVLREVTAAGVTSRVLHDAEDFESTLRTCFALEVPARSTCGHVSGAGTWPGRPARTPRSAPLDAEHGQRPAPAVPRQQEVTTYGGPMSRSRARVPSNHRQERSVEAEARSPWSLHDNRPAAHRHPRPSATRPSQRRVGHPAPRLASHRRPGRVRARRPLADELWRDVGRRRRGANAHAHAHAHAARRRRRSPHLAARPRSG